MELLMSIPGWNFLIPIVSILLFSTAHRVADRDRSAARNVEIVLLYSVGIIGFNGVASFFTHTIWADLVADSIGWAAGSPFQQEVAGANLAIGLIGFLGFRRRDFWLPFLLAKLIFGWTAGVVHVVDLALNGNNSPNNAGPILAWDFLLPVILLCLYAFMRRAKGPELPNAMPIRPLVGGNRGVA